MPDLLETRIRFYEMLTSVFYPPRKETSRMSGDPALIERLVTTLEESDRGFSLHTLPRELIDEIHGLSSSLQGDETVAGPERSLDVEYVRLFVNDFPTLWAPPYESYYREGRTMGKVAIDCCAFYEEDGLALSDDGELPDHIVTQLEYLLFLCLAEQKAVEGEDALLSTLLRQRQQRFFDKHIMAWIPEFCHRIQSHSRLPYYRIMAAVLKNFIDREYRFLNHKQLDPLEEGIANEVNKS